MEYRTLGPTGLRISEIGFGCGNTAGLMVTGSAQERLEAVSRALELGINYFDTASSYGDGLSETHLGQTLRELGAHPVVATKVRLLAEDLDDIAGAVVRSVEASLSRLRMESVDLIQLHNRVNVRRVPGTKVAIGPLLDVEDFLGPGGLVEGFERLRQQGKVRCFGFCGFGGEVPAMRQVIDSGRVDAVLVYYNILNATAGMPTPPGFQGPDYEQIIDYADARGVGAIVLRVLAAGALAGVVERHSLAGSGSSSTAREYEADLERARALAFLEQKGRHSMAKAAIRFALMKEEVSTVLVGFSSLAHVEEAAACSGIGGLSAADMARLEELWRTGYARVGQG